MSQSNNRKRLQPMVNWLVVVLVPGLAFIALLSTSTPVVVGDLDRAGLESVLLAGSRLAGLLLSSWLVASQLLYTLAILTDSDRLAELLRPVTIPLVRHAAAGLATVSISLGSMTAVAQTHSEPTTVTIDYDSLRQEATPTPNLEPLVEVEPDECNVDEPAGSYSEPLTWLVRPGDHLWKIAGEHLTIVLDRPPSLDEHTRYWIEVIDAARPVIRSGDPDLIYPGEQIPLPPTLDAGVRP